MHVKFNGMPAISIPAGKYLKGLLFGLQLTCKPFDDAGVMAQGQYIPGLQKSQNLLKLAHLTLGGE